MKMIFDRSVSRNPIQVPDEADLNGLRTARDKIAKEIESHEFLLLAKESPKFEQLVLDSFESMRAIETTAMRLDPRKPDFAIAFAGLQGRWRERISLTEEYLSDTRRMKQKKNLLNQISEKLQALTARLKSSKQS